MNIETAIAHLEAYIDGRDELGGISEKDALKALEFVRRYIAWRGSVIDGLERMQENEWHKLNEEAILAERDE